jgi:hypothetical protein
MLCKVAIRDVVLGNSRACEGEGEDVGRGCRERMQVISFLQKMQAFSFLQRRLTHRRRRFTQEGEEGSHKKEKVHTEKDSHIQSSHIEGSHIEGSNRETWARWQITDGNDWRGALGEGGSVSRGGMRHRQVTSLRQHCC